MAPKPLISLVIVNWNGKRFLKELFASIRQQKGPFRLQTIIVDNGSQDGSLAVLKKARLPGKTLVFLPENRGFAGGNNAGLTAAHGDYIFFLNNDTILAQNCINHLWKSLQNNSDFAIAAAAMIRYADKRTIDTLGDNFLIFGKARKNLEGKPWSPKFPAQEVFSACAGAALFKRQVLDEVGWFDERFFHTFEDIDLCFRARLAGYRVITQPLAVVYHHVGASRQIKSDWSVFHEHRNMDFVIIKNLPLGMLVLLAGPIMLFRVYSLLKLCFKQQGTVFVNAKLAVMRSGPAMLCSRHTIQKQKTKKINLLKYLSWK